MAVGAKLIDVAHAAGEFGLLRQWNFCGWDVHEYVHEVIVLSQFLAQALHYLAAVFPFLKNPVWAALARHVLAVGGA